VIEVAAFGFAGRLAASFRAEWKNSAADGLKAHMGKRIYCGNLSFQATQEDIRALFAPHGEVTDVHVVMDRETGRARGFAFVEMANEAQAKAAITALDGHAAGGRNLKVNEAQAREDRGGAGGAGGGGYGGGGGGSRRY
jgi:RNA recognition motif-containing protein